MKIKRCDICQSNEFDTSISAMFIGNMSDGTYIFEVRIMDGIDVCEECANRIKEEMNGIIGRLQLRGEGAKMPPPRPPNTEPDSKTL